MKKNNFVIVYIQNCSLMRSSLFLSPLPNTVTPDECALVNMQGHIKKKIDLGGQTQSIFYIFQWQLLFFIKFKEGIPLPLKYSHGMSDIVSVS